MPDLTEEGVKSQGKFGIRAFPVFYPGIEGELYVFTYTNDKGESWASHAWAHTTYLNSYPQAVIPSLPGQLECLHGLTVISSESGRPISARLDYRSDTSQTRLSRESILQRRRTYGGDAVPLELIPRLEQILKEHLATSPQANSEDAWQYKQRLVSYFPLPEFWTSTPSTIRIHQEHGTRLLSLQDILTFPVIRTLVPEEVLYRYVFRYPKQSRSSQRKLITRDDTPTITGDDLERLSDEHRTALFKGRSVGNVRRLNSGDLALDWSLSSERKAVILLSPGIYFMEVTELPNPTTIGIAIHKTTHDIYGHILLNINNSFVQWLLNAHDACNQGTHDLRTSQSNTLLTLLAPPLSFAGQKLRELKTYINQWRKIPNLPTELYPPEIELTEDMFTFSEADSS
jgi:hypothetical protein